MKKHILFSCLIVITLSFFSTALAASYNGHDYYMVITDEYGIPWQTASLTAESFFGGYLAAITSSGEQAFVESMLAEIDGFGMDDMLWIGGFKTGTEPSPDQGWEWVTGEPWAYTNWDAPPEPDNDNPFGLPEYFLAMNAISGKWGDEWVNADENTVPDYMRGFIVEVVPIPSALWMLGSGLVAMAGIGRFFGRTPDSAT